MVRKEVKKRKVSLKGVSYNNTDIVFNRFKMFKALFTQQCKTNRF